MRNNTASSFHHFEGLFYIGVALTLFTIVLLCLRRLAGERLVAALSVAAMLIFAFSALRMSQLNNSNQTAELAGLREAAVADFEVIRNTADGNTILTNSLPKFINRRHVVHYYLSGSPIQYGYETVSPEKSPDFIVTSARADGLASLTPQNRLMFLYEWNDYHRHITETIDAGEPLIRSHFFDVYLSGNSLIYVKDGCGENDTDAGFFLAAFPVDESDLPDGTRQRGFQNLDFRFQENGIRQIYDRCIAIAPLPDYDIARISTGQYIRRADGSTQRLWKGEIFPSNLLINARMRHTNETIAQAGEPLIRSDFDVYINDNMLIYVKDNCGDDDADAPFFLAAFPVNETDLPDWARQYGFQNLDFRFQENGIRQSGDRCIAITPLPDYDIARISTGQYIRRADGSTIHAWEGEIRLTEATP